MGAVATATFTVLAFAIVFQFLFRSLLNSLLAAIDNLSTITHMFLVRVALPANVAMFFASLFPLIAFDMFYME